MPSLNASTAVVFTPASEADLRLIQALDGASGYDIEGAIQALADGANPNRPHEDKWNKGSGYALYYSVVRDFDRHPVVKEMGEAAFRAAHLRLIKAMARAGADFSLPTFPGSNSSCSDIVSAMWQCEAVDPEATLVFAKGGGHMGALISEGSFCTMLNQDELLADPQRMEILWKAGLESHLKSVGFKTTILTRLLGEGGGGHLKAAQWLIERGASCAPLIERGMTSDQNAGYTALHLLGVNAAFYGRPQGPSPWGRRPSVTLESLSLCARLAMDNGADINAYDSQGRTAIQVTMMKGEKNHPALSLAWCKELARLGALPLKTAGGAPLLAHACADTPLAMEQMEIARSMGCDPRVDGVTAARALLSRAPLALDKTAAAVVERLAALGADFKQGADHPPETCLLKAAASSGLAACVSALIKAGCDPRWVHAKTGASLAGIACELSSEATGHIKGTDNILKIAIQAGAPLELRNAQGLSPLHWAAKALESAKCEALLAAGANPNALDKTKQTPLMLAAKRFGPRLEPALNKTLAAFFASDRADWTLTDKKGHSVFSVLCKKASVEALLNAASRDPNCLDEASVAGKASVRALKERADGSFERVEKAALESSGLRAPKKARAAKSI